jgi:hypothetical protein
MFHVPRDVRIALAGAAGAADVDAPIELLVHGAGLP